jgi:mRNA-degrading endonuclease RelE of RelBE toxin-antitoxin system
MAASRWKVSFRPQADRQLRQLDEDERADCLDILEDMRDGYFPDDRLPLRGHRNVERVKFYRTHSESSTKSTGAIAL